MDQQSQNPDPASPLHELNGGLRRAVDAVRANPVPQEALERATERAREQPHKTLPVTRRRRKLVVMVAGLAAVLCVAALGTTHFWMSRQNPSPSSTGREFGELFFGRRLVTEPQVATLDEQTVRQLRSLGYMRGGEENAAKRGNLGPEPHDPSAQALVVKGSSRLHNVPVRGFITSADDLRRGEGGDLKGQQENKPPPPPPAQGPANDAIAVEAYSHYHDNPFLRSAANALSTFSTTVDTASYSNVRRILLTEKRLPPPDAVRVAELINYFPYTYAQPKGEHPVAFTLDLATCPWQPKHHLVRVALKGKQLDPQQLPPRNFVFLLDTSGSMNSPNRLPLLTMSLTLLVDQLTANDRVALVAYAGSAGLVLPPTPGNDKDAILKALSQLEAGGSTNGGQGIQLAYKIARESFLQGGINRVILGTDGDFNVGVTSEGDLVRLIEEERKSGVFLTILGFGMGNLKDATMERLAHHGSGQFAYIDSLAEARKIFVEQGCSLVTIAKDVKLQVEFNPRLVGAYRLIGYENKLMKAEDFNDDRKHAGDLGSGHTVTALYEIIPPGLPVPGENVDPLKYQKPLQPAAAAGSDEYLTVKMRYKDPQADTSKLQAQPLTGGVRKLADAPVDFRFAAAVASFGMLLRNSEFRGDATYARTLELARGALGKDENGHRKEFLHLVEAAAALPAK